RRAVGQRYRLVENNHAVFDMAVYGHLLPSDAVGVSIVYSFALFSNRASTAFSSSTAPSSSAMASVASSSGSGRSSASSSDSSFSHLKLSSLKSRSSTSTMAKDRQRSSFESAGFRLARPLGSAL